MNVEFIGCVSHRESGGIHLPAGPAVNPTYIAAVVQTHEYGGFDRVPIAHSSARAGIARNDAVPSVATAQVRPRR